MKKSIFYTGLLLSLVLMLTATTAFAAPADPSTLLKPKKTAVTPTEGTPQAEITPVAHGKSDSQANSAKNLDKAKKSNFRGVVTASDATSLTLELKDGSEQVFTLDENTVIKYPTHFIPAATEAATATETSTATVTPEGPLAAGLQVTLQAEKQADNSFLALKIMVIPGKPEKMQHVGEVTAYTEGKSIEIKAKDGQLYTFELSDNTRYLPEGSTVKVGDTVTIIMPRVLTGQPMVAAGVVVHAADAEAESSD